MDHSDLEDGMDAHHYHERDEGYRSPSHPGQPPLELLIMLGRIDGKMDAVIQRLELNDKHHEQLDDRVSALERWRAWILGVVAVISTVVALLASDAFHYFVGQ
jgi:hypothetical protein